MMRGGLSVRPASGTDAEAIYELFCDMEQSRLPHGPFVDILGEQLADARHHLVLVAERDGQVVGALHLRMEPQLHHGAWVAEVMELAVAEGSRSAGVGHALLAQASELAREAGCVQIEVACNRLRERAHAFYRREGMRDFHLKFSRPLVGEAPEQNALGR